MAVQAQHPSDILPEARNRTPRVLGIESQGLFAPIFYGTSVVENCQFPALLGVSNAANQQRLLHSTGVSIPGQPATTVALLHHPGPDPLSQVLPGTRKRTREHAEHKSGQRHQLPPLSLGDHHKPSTSPVVQQPSGLVSTGLRLAFDDEPVSACTTTSGRTEAASTVFSSLFEDVSAHLMQQQEEFDRFLAAQGDQFKQALEEARQKQSRALLATIGDSVSKRFTEKEIELEKLIRRNVELEDRLKQYSFEAHMWKTKAKSNEAMITALRTNLQQAVAQSREQSKEGCGDSEADDAASANYDDKLTETHPWALKSSKDWNKDALRACRICRTSEVSILLLPCRHLCICKNCEGQIEKCPLCQCLRSASVEVYMS
eukprot:c28070_g2_i1 orf=500-1621(+)